MKKIMLIACTLEALLFPGFASADTHAAATCAEADVETAIAAASTGDTVIVPAGSCTWSSIAITGKALTLQGAGVGSSIITLSGASVISASVTTTNFLTIKDFTFMDGNAASQTGTLIGFTADINNQDVGFRLTNTYWPNVRTASAMQANGVFGLVDNNTFTNDPTGGLSQMIRAYGHSTYGDVGWNVPFSIGTNKAVYVENNTFNGPCDGVVDGGGGARFVVRYNDFYASGTGTCRPSTHGTDSTPSRSVMWVEVYENNYNDAGGVLHLRGGSGMAYKNHYVSGTGGGITLQYYRAWGSGSGWLTCDGTNYYLATNRTSASTTSGYKFCVNNLDDYCSTSADCDGSAACDQWLDGAGTCGYPGRDQPGRVARQELYPVYEFLNDTELSGIGGWCGQADCTPISGDCFKNDLSIGLVQLNRDAYAYTASFTGATGTGSGTTATRPATCTAGVAYWSTDENKLYQCATTNTWTLFYTPYTYPHPLTVGGEASDTTPNPFYFVDNVDVAVSTIIYSTPIQVLGIDDNTSITSSGANCFYQVNGAGSWLTTGGDNVSLNDNVAMKVTSSPNYSTDTPCVLTINGDVSDTWHVTTQAAVEDTFPPVPARGRFHGRGRWR